MKRLSKEERKKIIVDCLKKASSIKQAQVISGISHGTFYRLLRELRIGTPKMGHPCPKKVGHPPTPSFPMEKKKPFGEVKEQGYKSRISPKQAISGVEAQIKKIVRPIFDKVAQETPSRSMTPPVPKFSFVWRPNNYRREIRAKPKNLFLKGVPKGCPKPHPQNKIITWKEFHPQITVQYGREKVTAIFSQKVVGGVKEHFLIESDSIAGVTERINLRKSEIQDRLDSALIEFLKLFKAAVPFEVPRWSRYEDFLKGEDYIDKLPRDCIIHDTYFKKVYDEGVEFKSSGEGEDPTVGVKNYIKNRAVEDVSPEIARELAETRGVVEDSFKKNDKLLNDLIKNNVVASENIVKTQALMKNLLGSQSVTNTQLQVLIKTLTPKEEQQENNTLDKPDYFG